MLQAERDVHSLEILEVKREDMGEYSAYISNAAGSAYSSARLIVLSMYANILIAAYPNPINSILLPTLHERCLKKT